MEWKVYFSRRAEKFFLSGAVSRADVLGLVHKTILKFKGKAINVDIGKLHGKWKGFYRIRDGEIRIIVAFDFKIFAIFVEVVDWHGSAY